MQEISKIFELPGMLPIKLIYVAGGEFLMGEGVKVHEVQLNDYYIAEFPVTQDLYEKTTKQNPSRFKGKRKPVEKVNWYEAIEFCNLLSEKLDLSTYYTIDKEKKDKNNKTMTDEIKWTVEINEKAGGFRLPTEAEWEYAAQGGQKSKVDFKFSGSNNLEQVGWFKDNSYRQTKEVGLKFPNELEIYDMSGNVWEWCWDLYGDYKKEKEENPTGAESGSFRGIRGGSWIDLAGDCRVATRFSSNPGIWNSFIGFRLALSL